MHQTALGYTNQPTAGQRATYGVFYEMLGSVLPCDECASHLRTLMRDLPVAGYLDTSSTLFEWTVLLHNRVNAALGREEWTLDRALLHHALPYDMCVCGGGGGEDVVTSP